MADGGGRVVGWSGAADDEDDVDVSARGSTRDALGVVDRLVVAQECRSDAS